MRLKRTVENGQIIFRNADTNEIVKTESQAQPKKESNSLVPNHISITAIILSTLGIINLIFCILVFFLVGSETPFLGLAAMPAAFGLFVLAMVFIALAEIVYNAQYQTKLLKKFLETRIN